MHIVFGLHLDGLQPRAPQIAAGEATLGPRGLLEVLETQLGLPAPEAHPSASAFVYLRCLREATSPQPPIWVHELIEARDEKRLLRLQAQLARVNLLIVDELGYVPLSQTGSELLFDVFSRRYENGATIVTSNLPFQEWTTVFTSERLTGALLDRITHHVHILEMNGESYRLKQSRSRRRQPSE